MQAKRLLLGLLVVAGIAAYVVLRSWLDERQKYAFEDRAVEVGRQLPGARLIPTAKVIDPLSVVTWFRPTASVVNFAMPDLMEGRFTMISMLYEKGMDPDVWIIDAECGERSYYAYTMEGEGGPALDVFGEPVTTPDGRGFRQAGEEAKLPEQWARAFCETDWTPEREAMAAERK